MKEIEKFYLWEVRAKVRDGNNIRFMISTVMAENELCAIDEMIEELEEKGIDRANLWQASYEASLV